MLRPSMHQRPNFNDQPSQSLHDQLEPASGLTDSGDNRRNTHNLKINEKAPTSPAPGRSKRCGEYAVTTCAFTDPTPRRSAKTLAPLRVQRAETFVANGSDERSWRRLHAFFCTAPRMARYHLQLLPCLRQTCRLTAQASAQTQQWKSTSTASGHR